LILRKFRKKRIELTFSVQLRVSSCNSIITESTSAETQRTTEVKNYDLILEKKFSL